MSRPNYYKSILSAKCKLEQAEKALIRSKNLLNVIEERDLLEAKNTFLRQAFNEMFNKYSVLEGNLHSEICSKIKRILYEVDAQVEKGERAGIK